LGFPDGRVLRDAEPADLPAVVAIYNSTIPGRMVTADLQPVAVETRHSWLAEHTPDRHPLWVLAAGGEVAAWLSFQPFYGRPAYAATAEVSVYVREDRRGRGLGGRLLTEALAACPRLGLCTLLGFVFAHNAPSLRLFARLGFQRWGHLPRIARLDGVERDLVIVGRRVPWARGVGACNHGPPASVKGAEGGGT